MGWVKEKREIEISGVWFKVLGREAFVGREGGKRKRNEDASFATFELTLLSLLFLPSENLGLRARPLLLSIPTPLPILILTKPLLN